PLQMGVYGTGSKLAQLGAKANLTNRIARHMGASAAVTAPQSYLIQLRDGESSWMQVVRDLGINAAFDTIGLGSLRKAWQQELGPEATKVVSRIAKAAGVAEDVAELKITQVRAGGGVQDIKVAEAIVQAGKKEPRLRNTPLDHQ